ncbi:HEAT repeat domain-containing protein [Subtercola sp. PAMC28395]|uniref:HEAT repeat domain-containing protein n=1 Tax=Subtercola sp. PAMC28395 TaxID=2846775 RepID=UPI001C0C75B7|nr:HEAT repeat domain-containing protein [Subtercola sp. PAMC28395]QWT24428.1 HEAT repeat domain-containing protein [Subtercola sp. PAMC28395]
MADQNASPSSPDDSLEERLHSLVLIEGENSVARRARSLLAGGYEGEDFLRVVGGPHAEGILAGAPALYWPELWGARALLYVWDDAAAPAVLAGLANQSWRVREMAARVCATRSIGIPSDFARLTTDEYARVRSAAARAIAAVGDEASIEVLERLLRDRDKEVRRAAQQSLDALRARLHEA